MQLTSSLVKVSAILALAATSISAVSIADVPSCAMSCAAALPAECNLNPKCICSDVPWLTKVACCVEESCNGQGLKAAFDLASQVCGTLAPGVDVKSTTCKKGGNETATATGGKVGGGKVVGRPQARGW